MKPRDFLNFFKTKSGKLVLFVALFGGGLLVFSVLRGNSGSDDDMDVRVTGSQTNMTDKPQVVQSVVRPMQHQKLPSNIAHRKPHLQHLRPSVCLPTARLGLPNQSP